jgi:hypothetical protein
MGSQPTAGGKTVMQRAMIANGTLAYTPKPNCGGGENKDVERHRATCRKQNRAQMEWPGPRTYLDDVWLQLRLGPSSWGPPNRISRLCRYLGSTRQAVFCQSVSKHATLVRPGSAPRWSALARLTGICDVILVRPDFTLKILPFVLPTVTSRNGCGKYLSVSNCVLRQSEVAGASLVSVTKHKPVVLESG